ncbi:MAG TPA: hypothetical protein GXX36_00960 [Clostridiaceae bacterium]|nr:hypothetical protein [Clostridiaceae bacterium]
MTQKVDCPDVSGFTLGEARAFLKNAGFEISSITTTSPPRRRHTDYNDSFRVLRINNIEGTKVELLVSDTDQE